MPNDQMITIRNKNTGEVKTVPRSSYVQSPESKGVAGIGNDISSSMNALPDVLSKMIPALLKEGKQAGRYATTTNPVSTMANLGVGGVEAGAGLASSPQKLMRYLSEKFPKFGEALQRGADPGSKGVNDPTLYEGLMNFEKNHGMSPQSEDEASVRNAGGLYFGGGGLSKIVPRGTTLKNILGAGTTAGTVAAQQGGQGGDPLHALILALLGHTVGKGVNPVTRGSINVARQIPAAVQAIPEVSKKAAASGLETIADATSLIPGVGKIAQPVIQPTLGAFASYLKHIAVEPEELAKRNLFGDIEAEDVPGMEKMNEAGKRLNLTYNTPSELMDSPFESVKQANVGRTTKGMKALYKLGKEREGSEESAINKLFDLIHTDKLEPAKKAAYEATMSNNVPDEFIAKHTSRPVIQKAQKAVENNTAFKQMLQEEYGVSPDNVSKNSFMYWDMVKRVLGDMEKKLGRKGADTEASVYGNTRRSMVKDLDAIEPKYKTARNIAERKFTRDELNDVFDKKDKTFNNFDSFLKSKENMTRMREKLDAFPEALQQLEDIKLFSGNLIPNNPKIRAAAALKRTGMSDARNALEAKKREYDERYGQEHDLAEVKLMTHPDLMSLLKQHLKDKGKL